MENKLLAIFATSVLLLSVTGSNFGFNAFAQDSSDVEDNEEKRQEMEEKREQMKEKIAEEKQKLKELREEYKSKLEEKRKKFVDFKKDLRKKFNELKKEYREKFLQLRISQIPETEASTSTDESSSLSEDEKYQLKIKREEFKLLKHEFREHIKSLKLEAREHFKLFKQEMKSDLEDRKNMMHDRIAELKEKYKLKIREHENRSPTALESLPPDYEDRKIIICHVPPENPDNAHTLSISKNAWRAHMAHGDYLDECKALDENDETDHVVEIEIEVKIEDGIAKINVKIDDEELEFELEDTDRDIIMQHIAEKTDLSLEEIENNIEFEEYEVDETEDETTDEEGENYQVTIKEEIGISQNEN